MLRYNSFLSIAPPERRLQRCNKELARAGLHVVREFYPHSRFDNFVVRTSSGHTLRVFNHWRELYDYTFGE